MHNPILYSIPMLRHIQKYRSLARISGTDFALFSTYGEWGRSIMFYTRDARYFGPEEVYFMRLNGPQRED